MPCSVRWLPWRWICSYLVSVNKCVLYRPGRSVVPSQQSAVSCMLSTILLFSFYLPPPSSLPPDCSTRQLVTGRTHSEYKHFSGFWGEHWTLVNTGVNSNKQFRFWLYKCKSQDKGGIKQLKKLFNKVTVSECHVGTGNLRQHETSDYKTLR